MRLYIANGTQQYIDFQYRLRQIVLSGELSAKDIERIIEHHSIYGLVSSKEFTNYRGSFVQYIYSVDEPIPAETISALIMQNREYNIYLGARLRKEAAITVNQLIEENSPDALKSLEVSIVEEQSKDRDATFSEGIRVTRDRERGAPQEPTKNPIDFSTAKRRSMF
jgi:hypothetical protein